LYGRPIRRPVITTMLLSGAASGALELFGEDSWAVAIIDSR
jgi:hypothetical protein